MLNSIFKTTLILFAVATFSCQSNEPLTEVYMPKFFADHMVLQRNQPIRVWGDGTPGKRVLAKFNNQEKETEIDDAGFWMVEFDPMPASGPFELDVNGKKIRDVQVGDVWVAGGQSNMEWVMSAQVEGLQEEIADSDYSLIRFFKIPHDYDAVKKNDVRGGEWRMANADNILNFSAVAWFFAKRNHLEKGVPIGIIESNWGGTPAEGWTASSKLIDFPPYSEKAKDVEERKEYWIQEVIDNKLRELKRNELVAAPQNGEIKGVVNTNFDDSNWQTVNLPRDNPFSDIAWFRKKFTLTETENITLNLGDIQQMAYIYLNGGRLLVKDYGDAVKEFTLPAGMLVKGENLLVVRIVNTWNNSPVLGKSGEFFIKSRGKKISLEGEWKYNNKVEEEIPKVEWYNWLPGMMYNAMIAPIVKYPIKGVIWYQGESNAGEHQYYKQLFGTMIQNWREAWGIGDFPFLFVQLANFMERKDVQPDSDWAFLREAQTQTLELPNTGMAVTIDVGNADDIHPRNKKDVGHRLWQAAKKVAYGEEVVHAGPTVSKAEKKGDKVIITFDFVGDSLKLTSGTEVLGFILKGEDGNFESAKGSIIGPNQVEVYSAAIKNPTEIRYAWADNPEVNLYNSLDLPAVPFRQKIQ
ncbi:sialate O-acetylesterase [Aquiflexum gelatinilyticum]|uniref:sialate O-acetylesterase n=1 Tax=Aquiflexum gelatinilyticum TaxID=2961943 RepID=UPI002166E9D3|nr:sialate O-acetylesterase [Aquiflexum gelatinilyticum]MCS4434498.1 sialate O-acetylesterase [Aquiflexum gelatinilyticum]